jgi:hypothetical protein
MALWGIRSQLDVAEGLVHAYAVKIHGQSLRRAEQGRGRIAAEAEVRLVGIALHFVDGDAGQFAIQRVRQVGAGGGGQIAAVQMLHVCGHLIARQRGAGQRRRAYHLHRLHYGAGIGIGVCCPCGQCQADGADGQRKLLRARRADGDGMGVSALWGWHVVSPEFYGLAGSGWDGLFQSQGRAG